jgi:hypothetical protein
VYARVDEEKKVAACATTRKGNNTIHGHYRGGSSFILHHKRIELPARQKEPLEMIATFIHI